MCGICGVLFHDPGATPDRIRLAEMRDALRHRGPDDAGILIDGPVGLAHRRLSILDTSPAGHQPMSDAAGEVHVAYNGELYNYASLRRLCTERGVALRSQSDTETLPYLWRFFGPRMLDHMRGMFALALWDRGSRTLFLARDRFGQKPLHYAVLPDRVLFASELKALLVDPGFPRDLDPDALRDYLAVGYVPDPATIYRAARKLPAGTWLAIKPGEPVPEPRRYWEHRFRPDHSVSAAEWAARLEEKLAETVRCHMVSDVPLGAFLSGGVDSSTVVALMQRASDRPVRTFSIGFEEEAYSELPFARAVAKHVGADHTDLVVRPDKVELVEKLAGFFDEPFADSSALPTYLVSELARKSVTVALSGDGGDELFGGYNRYIQTLDDVAITRSPEWARRAIFARLARRWPAWLKGKGRLQRIAAGRKDGDYVERTLGLVGRSLGEQLLSDDVRGARDPFARWEAYLADERSPLLDRMQRNDIESYLPGDILVKVDRASMAVSLETRAPLLDHELAELAGQIPAALLCDRRSGKNVLKAVARRLVPADCVDRKKMGFGIPLAEWFRRELKPMLNDLLLSGARTEALYQPGAMRALLEEHWSGRADRGYVIWTLLALELFHRRWVTPSPVTAAR